MFFSGCRWVTSSGSQKQCGPVRQGLGSPQSQPPAVQEERLRPQDATASDEAAAGTTLSSAQLVCGPLTYPLISRRLRSSPQLQNQEVLRVQLKRAEQEISVKLAEAMRRLEDPVQRQRVLVEEDRHKYLGLEERVLTQLG